MLPDTISISNQTGASPTTCSCNSCKIMCHKQVCMGTPGDILAIANNGFGAHLIDTTWAVGLMFNLPLIEMVQIRYDTERKCCAMLDDNGLCGLHALGIKPTEGVLSDMHGTNRSTGAKMVLAVANEWMNQKNRNTIRILNKLIEKQ